MDEMKQQPDRTPEQIAADREAALRALRGEAEEPVRESMGGAPQPADEAAEVKLSVDLEEVARQARAEQRRQPIELIGRNTEGAWKTRSEMRHGLVAVDDHGVPIASVKRAVDLEKAPNYGEMSKQAIKVINEFFAKPQCSEIHMNSPDEIFAKVNGKRVKVNCEFSSLGEYTRYIEDLINQAETHKTLKDIKHRGRDVVKMAGGDRMAIMLPPFVDTPQISIHKVIARAWDMQTLIDNGTLTPKMAEFLSAAVKAKCNILICGELGAGKSVMLSLLAKNIGDNERVALIEEVPEIFLDKPDVTRITYYPDSITDVPMGLPEVLDTVLYMRMDRVIIGEIHERGMYRMLRVMALGADGSMSTFHAGDVGQALEQVRNHVLLEHPQLPADVASHFIRQALNLVVVVERVDEQHRVVEVAEIDWRNTSGQANTVGRNMLFRFDRDRNVHVCESKPDVKGRIRQKFKKHRVVFKEEWFAQLDLQGQGGIA